jgi:uncharacterized phage protein (predicted DNA packaging)
MVALVSLDAAKRHLRVTVEADDEDIQRKIEQASAIVLDYVKQRYAMWTPDSVPKEIEAAVMLMLTSLYDDRDAGSPDGAVALGYLPPTVTAILHRYRDPALA